MGAVVSIIIHVIDVGKVNVKTFPYFRQTFCGLCLFKQLDFAIVLCNICSLHVQSCLFIQWFHLYLAVCYVYTIWLCLWIYVSRYWDFVVVFLFFNFLFSRCALVTAKKIYTPPCVVMKWTLTWTSWRSLFEFNLISLINLITNTFAKHCNCFIKLTYCILKNLKSLLTLTVLGYFAPWEYWGGGGGGARPSDLGRSPRNFARTLEIVQRKRPRCYFKFSKTAYFISYDNLCKLYA